MGRIALLSVSDKTGIVEFAGDLIALKWVIVSTGGTAEVIRDAGLAVTDIAEISGVPAILGDRVKTLVPHVHGGLLAMESQRAELHELVYPWIDLLCVNFYPLEEETMREGATRESVIEATDIGGPAMARSAAKGRRIPIVDPADYSTVIQWLRAGEPNSEEFRNLLAAMAEAEVAAYCLRSASYHSSGLVAGQVILSTSMPDELNRLAAAEIGAE